MKFLLVSVFVACYAASLTSAIHPSFFLPKLLNTRAKEVIDDSEGHCQAAEHLRNVLEFSTFYTRFVKRFNECGGYLLDLYIEKKCNGTEAGPMPDCPFLKEILKRIDESSEEEAPESEEEQEGNQTGADPEPEPTEEEVSEPESANEDETQTEIEGAKSKTKSKLHQKSNDISKLSPKMSKSKQHSKAKDHSKFSKKSKSKEGHKKSKSHSKSRGKWTTKSRGKWTTKSKAQTKRNPRWILPKKSKSHSKQGAKQH